MAAIALNRLEFMRKFKQKLAVPVATDRGEQFLDTWDPTLGAYTVNKASTFLANVSTPEEETRNGQRTSYIFAT